MLTSWDEACAESAESSAAPLSQPGAPDSWPWARGKPGPAQGGAFDALSGHFLLSKALLLGNSTSILEP